MADQISCTLKSSLNSSKRIINDFQYSVEDCIGRGEFSSVYKGINKKTGQLVAIKIIQNSQLNNPISKALLNSEIQSLKNLTSPYILQILSYICTQSHQYLITEYCEGGELGYNRNYSQRDLLNIFHCLLLALKELKNKQIIHRDIKPPNILIKNNIPKLADFGFSLNVQNQELQKSSYGTPLYMAPESLINDCFTYQSDVWSLGITMFELIYGQVPFYHPLEQELRQILKQYTKNPVLQIPDSPFKYLLKGMLDPNPNTRYTVEQLITMISQNQNVNTNINPNTQNNKLYEFFQFLSNFSQNIQKFESVKEDQILRWAIYRVLSQKFNLDSNSQQQLIIQMGEIKRNINTNNCKNQQLMQIFSAQNEQKFSTSLRSYLQTLTYVPNYRSIAQELIRCDTILFHLYS